MDVLIKYLTAANSNRNGGKSKRSPLFYRTIIKMESKKND